MKTKLTFLLIITWFAAISQPTPEKAPADPNYFISDQEMEEMKQNGIILPPVKPAFDPWAKYEFKGTKDFPVVYDMRQTGWLTPVKGQSSGACWAYSTMGAVESRWLMLGLGAYNLSDNNLKWCHKYVPERSTWGNHWMASAYFARRSGPFLETEDPYPGGTTSPDNCPTGLSAAYYITDSRYPPSQNMDAIKQTVLTTGLVWSLLYYSDTYYNAVNKTYYYGGIHEVNHAGCVIGWNDTLQTAGGTGAWIVRNTYGQGWGEGGYYYISYNDSQFLKYNGYWPNVMENDPNTTIYQYDEIGGYWGVGFSNEIGYGLVKFEGTSQPTRITKIGTFVVSYGCGVEIKIFDEFNTVVSGLLNSKDEVICELPGYYTFDLDSSLVIPAGEDFYVQIKYDSNDPADQWPISIEDAIAGYSNPQLEAGKCWIAPDPVTWPTYWYAVGSNTSYKYDLCIKAYAENLYPPTLAIDSPNQEEKFCDAGIQVTGTTDDLNNDVSMVEIRLNGGEWVVAAGCDNWTADLNLMPGINTIEVRATDLTNLISDIQTIEVVYSIQNIPLSVGWSIISAYLDPDNPNIVAMMQNVVSNLVMMTGKSGIYAPPPFNINTLGVWNVYEGYKIKMNAANELTFCGDALSDNFATFVAGSNLLPVLTNQNSPVDEIFANPQNDILYIVSIQQGTVYWPDGGIFSLTELEPGQGYLANFKNPVDVDFPDYSGWSFNKKNEPVIPSESPWQLHKTTNIHLISIDNDAIRQFESGYIGAFSADNQCIGFAEISRNPENVLLLVYGDDEFAAETAGINERDPIIFKYLNKVNGSVETLFAVWDKTMPQNDGLFHANGTSGITGFYNSTGVSSIEMGEMIQVFPQPANREINVVLPESLTPCSVELVSVNGRTLQTWQISDSKAVLDVEKFRPGVYFLRFNNERFFTKRITILE